MRRLVREPYRKICVLCSEFIVDFSGQWKHRERTNEEVCWGALPEDLCPVFWGHRGFRWPMRSQRKDEWEVWLGSPTGRSVSCVLRASGIYLTNEHTEKGPMRRLVRNTYRKIRVLCSEGIVDFSGSVSLIGVSVHRRILRIWPTCTGLKPSLYHLLRFTFFAVGPLFSSIQ
jgi:hypothetical protein